LSLKAVEGESISMMSMGAMLYSHPFDVVLPKYPGEQLYCYLQSNRVNELQHNLPTTPFLILLHLRGLQGIVPLMPDVL
jgi:hypothetical protein